MDFEFSHFEPILGQILEPFLGTHLEPIKDILAKLDVPKRYSFWKLHWWVSDFVNGILFYADRYNKYTVI